jgi:hypothetical protein
MEAPCGFAHNLFQARFDIHVNVFQLYPVWECVILHFSDDLIQTSLDCFIIFGANDALFGQHISVRTAASDIFTDHAAINIDRRIDGLHDVAGLCGEASAPHLLAFWCIARHIA